MLITVANSCGVPSRSASAVNLACELAGIDQHSCDRWQSTYKVILSDADPLSAILNYYSSGEHLPVSCEFRPLEDSNVDRWIQQVLTVSATVDYYLVMLNTPAPPAVPSALFGASDLVIILCSASDPDLAATAALVGLIRTVRLERKTTGPKCLLVPTCSCGGVNTGDWNEDTLRQFGEQMRPKLVECTAFEDAYRNRRWIGDFAWNSAAHKEIKALAMSVNAQIHDSETSRDR